MSNALESAAPLLMLDTDASFVSPVSAFDFEGHMYHYSD